MNSRRKPAYASIARFIVTPILAALLCNAAAADSVQITNAWANATPPGTVTAAMYMEIATDGAPDRLIGASTSVSREVQLHTHVERWGMMQMRRVGGFPIAQDAPAVLRPNGNHLMLLGLGRSLVTGDKIAVKLQFERAGVVEIDVPVVDMRTLR